MTSALSKLGVGIIGVSPTRGGAATAHIPALRALPNYEIRALSAPSAESAHAAGEMFGVSTVFSDHEQLVTQPDIDVVAVTVKVPHHRELVLRRTRRRQGRLLRVATWPRPRRGPGDGGARGRAGRAHDRRVAGPPGPVD